MVEKFGSESYKFNHISMDEFPGDSSGGGSYGGKNNGKAMGGCGGKASKSHNAKEMRNANKRRAQKYERAE